MMKKFEMSDENWKMMKCCCFQFHSYSNSENLKQGGNYENRTTKVAEVCQE